MLRLALIWAFAALATVPTCHSTGPASEHSRIDVSSRALARLSDCCSDSECREQNLSDLASALWNFAAASDGIRVMARNVVETCGIITAIERRLSLLRDSCNHRDSCLISRAIFEFHAMRYNILEPAENGAEWGSNVSGKSFGRASTVGEALTDMNRGWNPKRPFRLESRIAVPASSTVDFGLVVGWAAVRAGLAAGAWSNRSLLMSHVRAMRPYYPKYLNWFQADPEFNSKPEPSVLGKPRDLVWMIMHVVYVQAEFGLWQLSADQLAELDIELRFLNGCLGWARAMEDFEMLGELLDCLRCAQPYNVDLNGKSFRFSWLPTQEMKDATLYLVSQQNPDGSWGDPNEPNSMHTTHVCGLALLPRAENTLLQYRDSTSGTNALSDPVSNAAFWSIAKFVIQPKRRSGSSALLRSGSEVNRLSMDEM